MNPNALSLRRQWQAHLAAQVFACCVVSALLIWAYRWCEVSPRALAHGWPQFAEFLGRLVPPNWSVTGIVIRSTLETLLMAFAGTVLSVVISLPLGFMAASNVSPAWLSHPVKWLLGFLRAIPLIVVAILFVVGVGLGPFPGVMAIAFHSIGMLGKFYAEEFETADPGIVHAVQGTGATWLQTIRFGLLPQSTPQLVAFTVYRLEMNFRDAAVLGYVGAGGIGYQIKIYQGSFQYDKVATLLIVIIAVVTVLDLLTYWVRKRVR